jgi:hypothetical protein
MRKNQLELTTLALFNERTRYINISLSQIRAVDLKTLLKDSNFMMCDDDGGKRKCREYLKIENQVNDVHSLYS